MPLLAPGLGKETGRQEELRSLATNLTRLMLLSPVLFAVSGGSKHVAKMQHVFQRVIDDDRIAGLFLYTPTEALGAEGPLGEIWQNGAGAAVRLV